MPKSKQGNGVVISFRISKELHNEIKKIAASEKRTQRQIMLRLLEIGAKTICPIAITTY